MPHLQEVYQNVIITKNLILGQVDKQWKNGNNLHLLIVADSIYYTNTQH